MYCENYILIKFRQTAHCSGGCYN